MFLRRYFGKISFLPIGNLVGNNGELVIDEATDKIYVMDGVTPGGHEIANVDALAGNISGDIIPWQNLSYNIGNSSLQWNNLFVGNTITLNNSALTVSGGNLYIDGNPIIGGGGGSYNQDLNTFNSPTFANLNLTANLTIDTYINPNRGIGNWGNLNLRANRINANILYTQTSIETDGSITADNIFANGFVEINTNNFSGYTFSGLGGSTTGLIHSNVGSVPALYITSNGSTSLTTYANGYNTINGFTQFFSNVYITGNNVTIPNYTTIGLLPSFNPANARLTYVDSVNSYSQVLLQNKSNGTSASGDLVVTADNGSDSTYYIDLGINSSTFSGGGGLDIANDGYLLMEGGNLVVATLTANKDIVFGIGGDAPSNEVARFKSANGLIVNGNITTNGNVIPFGNSVYSLGSLNNQWKSLYVSNNTIYIAGTPVTVANGSLSIGGNTITASSLVNGAYTASLNINGDLYLPSNGGIYPTANDNAGLILYDTNNNNRGQLSAIGDINLRADSANAGVEWTFAANGNLITPNGGLIGAVDSGDPNSFGLKAGGSVNYVELNYDDDQRIWVDGGAVNIGTNAKTSERLWTFYPNGVMALPYSNYIETTDSDLKLGSQGGVTIRSNAATGGGTYSWVFANDGTTTFPDHRAVSITGNLTVGNLFVTGNSTVINTNSYTVSDNIIQLADQNPADILDLGFVAHRTVNSTLQHTGLVRDASANTWRLFSNITSQPGTTIDFTNAVYDTLQLGNVITTAGLYWSNGVSALTSAYGNTQVSAYYVANTVATSNVQILKNGNIRLPSGSTISESFGNGYIVLSPNTTVDGLAGVIIGGSGYLLSPNGSRNAVLNYNAVSGQFGTYILNVYGNQGNAIVNGGSNNYGNIGSISTFFGNAFVSNIYSQNYLYPNGTSILSGVSGTYGNTQVAAYLPTYSGNSAASRSQVTNAVDFMYGGFPYMGWQLSGSDTLKLRVNIASGDYTNDVLAVDRQTRVVSFYGNVSANNYANVNTLVITNNILWSNGVAFSSASSYGNTQVAAYLPTYSGNIGAGNVNVTANVNAANINVTGNLTYGNISTTGNVTAGWLITTGTGGNITGANYVIASNFTATGTANVGNVITTSGVYWANGVAYSSGSGTYGNTEVAAYLPTYAGNVNAAFYNGNGYYLTGLTGANYSNTNVASYILGNITVGNVIANGGGQLRGYHTGAIGANGANTGAFTTVSATGNITATTANVYATNIVGNTAVYSAAYNYANGAAYAGTYSNSNVASYLPTYTGNVGAGNLIGTSSNVTITAGANVWTFDNTGNLTLPNLGNVYVLGANTNGNININTLGTGSINLTGNLVANTAGFNIGYLNIPQVAFTANATIAATDSGKHYYSTLSTANTLTISNNAVTSWQVGTSISIVNGGSGTMTIAPASGVTLYLAGNSSSASRTLSSYGMATILNVAANVWYINGSGLA